MDDLWRRRVVFDSSYFMLPEATGDSEADRIDPAEEEEANRVSADDDDAKSSTNDPLCYYGTDGVVEDGDGIGSNNNNDSVEEADDDEVVCSNNKFDPNGVRSVFVDGLGCCDCEDGDETGLGNINDHKKLASDHECTHRMTETPMRTKTTSSSSSPSRLGSEVVNSYPKQQQLKGCTAKRKKAMTEMEKNRLFWDTCLAS